MGNPAEETYCHPNAQKYANLRRFVNWLFLFWGLYPIPFFRSISHSCGRGMCVGRKSFCGKLAQQNAVTQ